MQKIVCGCHSNRPDIDVKLIGKECYTNFKYGAHLNEETAGAPLFRFSSFLAMQECTGHVEQSATGMLRQKLSMCHVGGVFA